MKKLLFMVMACMALTACSNSDDDLTKEDNAIIKAEDVEIVVKGDYVISPEWIDKVRQEIHTDPKSWSWAVVGITAEYNGKTVVFFEDSSSSYFSDSINIYSLSGKKLEKVSQTNDLTNRKIFCPAFRRKKE